MYYLQKKVYVIVYSCWGTISFFIPWIVLLICVGGYLRLYQALKNTWRPDLPDDEPCQGCVMEWAWVGQGHGLVSPGLPSPCVMCGQWCMTQPPAWPSSCPDCPGHTWPPVQPHPDFTLNFHEPPERLLQPMTPQRWLRQTCHPL